MDPHFVFQLHNLYSSNFGAVQKPHYIRDTRGSADHESMAQQHTYPSHPVSRRVNG